VATFTEIQVALDDNADYAEVGSVVKAKAYQTALKRLLHSPQEAVHGGRGQGESTKYDMEQIKSLLDDVEQWIGGNDTSSTTGARVKYASFREYRT